MEYTVTKASDGTPAQALATHKDRISSIAKQYAEQYPLIIEDSAATEDNTIQLIAHLQAGLDDPNFPSGQEPSLSLALKMLRKLNTGNRLVGTNIDEIFPGTDIKRPGDYDAALKGLIVIVYRYRNLLTDEVFNYILDNLVPAYIPGANPSLFETIKILDLQILDDIDIPETENHMLLISSSIYLINQLFWDRTNDRKYDNNENGLIKWLLNYMHTIAKHDFLEFNARPYTRYSLHALLNLHEFARDKSIRDAAQILLDYTMVKFAVSSNRQRRIGPFRRLKENSNSPTSHNDLFESRGSDAVIGFFLMYAGPSDSKGIPTDKFRANWGMEALIAGLAAYRPPRAAYILAMKRDIPAFQQRFYHGNRPQVPASGEQAEGGVEIYYKSPSFMLTAGGMFLNSGYGRDESIFQKFKQVAIAQSTTLIPTRADVNFSDLIRFDRHPNERDAVNTAVHMGFACGANLRPFGRKIFDDTTTHSPSLAFHNNRMFLAWKGSEDEDISVAKVRTTELMDGIEELDDKAVLDVQGITSDEAPALASHNGRLFLAWKGDGNENLNLAFSDDNGIIFREKLTFGETSSHAPAIASHNGNLFLAWKGDSNEDISVAKVRFRGNADGGLGIDGLDDKVVLDVQDITSDESPALASHNGRLFLAWKGDGNENLNLAFSDDNGIIFREKLTFGETSSHAPTIASHNGNLFLAWKGDSNEDISVAKVRFRGNADGGLGIDGLDDKVVLDVQGITSDEAPVLASDGTRLFLGWKGDGNTNLNLVSSRDGSFQSSPWHFEDNTKKLGFYVAAYRTNGFGIDPPLDNLGFLYAMEANVMDFETFKRRTLEQNNTLPAKFSYGERYIFNSADNRRFSFWLYTSGEKYQARIVLTDEPTPVTDFTSLPLAEGPYLKTPNGHDGYIEIRYPNCDFPLVLDFRNPENPVREDNSLACPNTTQITMSATATGSTTPPTAVGNDVVNGNFSILRNPADASLVTGDGEDEETTWTFSFGEDPNLSFFSSSKPLTSALLTLTLTPKNSGISTDLVFIETIGVASDEMRTLPVNITNTVQIELLDRVSDFSGYILGLLFGTPENKISMRYSDDAIVSFAKLELTQESQLF